MNKGDAGELFVNNLAFNSFMNYWCYPSPKDEEGDKKEICDLLIIFGSTAIILSVKNYEFKDNYSRYFRRTIEKAVKQIYGAERKLFSEKRDVFIKHPNKNIERFPKEKIDVVFRVIINLGDGVKFYPFNRETKNEKFISLFDKEAFQTIVKELDTIPDFAAYLSKREDFFENKEVIILPGEEEDFPQNTATQFFEHAHDTFKSSDKATIILSGTEHDLLAHYLMNKRNFPEVLEAEKYNGLFIQLDGNWEEFITKRQVLRKKNLDKYSYFIDDLVEREILKNPNQESEELAKKMLSFDRFHRRMIANNFFNFYDLYKDNSGMNFARRFGDVKGIGVAFAFYPPDMEPKFVDVLLDIAFDSYCIFTDYRISSIIMIATTKEFKEFKIGLMNDIQPFPEEKERQVREDVKKLGWFTNHQKIQVTEYEYPGEEE